MSEVERARYEASLAEYLKKKVNRAQILKAAGVGLAAAAIPGAAEAAATPTTSGPAGSTPPLTAPSGTFSAPFFPQVGPGQTYQTEILGDIAAVALTAEHLAVTVLTNALTGPYALKGMNPLLTGVLQAALVQELDHVAFIEGFGDKPLTDSFSVPSAAIFGDPKTFFATLEAAESIFVAAYMTATREAAEAGEPTVAKWTYQIGGVEAEHRALARAAQLVLGVSTAAPPNNKSFETDMFLYVRDAAKLLGDLGFLGTGAVKLAYPGIAAGLAAAGPMAAAVVQRRPNNVSTSVTAATPNLTGEILTGAVGAGPAGSTGGVGGAGGPTAKPA